MSFADNEPRQILQNLVKFNIILILGQIFVIAQHVPEFTLTIQQLIQVSQKQFQLADVTTFLILADTLHENLVD